MYGRRLLLCGKGGERRGRTEVEVPFREARESQGGGHWEEVPWTELSGSTSTW